MYHKKVNYNNKIACGGSIPENCTRGYEGDLCGRCSKYYYKFRNKCNQCTSDAPIKFVLIIIAIAIISVLLFWISNSKVGHLASISIGFSLWQVLSMFANYDIKWVIN